MSTLERRVRRSPAVIQTTRPCRKPRAFLVSLGLAAGLASAATAQEAVTEERVRAAFHTARAAVEATLGFTLDPRVGLVFVEPEALGARVTAENLPIVRLREPDEAKAEAEARRLGAAFARFAFAKYAWSTREFLVVPALWEQQAERLGRPELTADATLIAVVVHELVHARDDAVHGLGSTLAKLDSNEAVVAFNAVLEGHAQFQARRVCASGGWSAGFEALTASIGAFEDSPGLDEGTRTLLRIQSATIGSAYHEGERFIAALDAAGGAELVARAFREPPRDGATIARPEWYIDPGSRPRARFDPEPALARFAGRFPADRWSSQRESLQPVQIEAALALLPKTTVAGIVDTLRASQVITLYPSADPSSKVAVLAVLEFESDVAAHTYVAAAQALGALKDERMKTGQLRVLSTALTELERPDLSGFLARRSMKNGTLALEAVTLDAVRGPVVLETVFSGEPIEDAALVELAGELFDALRELGSEADGPGPR